MNELPVGWTRVTVGEVCSRVTDGSHFSPQSVTSGWPYVTVKDLKAGAIDLDGCKQITKDDFEVLAANGCKPTSGDVLFSKDGTVGRVAVVDTARDFVVLSSLAILTPRQELIHPRFLAWALQSPDFQDQALGNKTGTALRRITLRNLKPLVLPLPPLDEQQRIVNILEDHLSRLDVAQDGLKRGDHRLTGYHLHAVKSLVLGSSLRSANRVAGLADVGVDDSVVVPLPDGWTWRRLGDVADVVGGVTKDSKKQSDPSFVEVPYLRVANVQRGRLDLREITTIRVSPTKAEALYLREGDVLLNEGGDRDKLGRGWVWQQQIAECIHQNHVFRARIKDDIVDPVILSWAANTLGGRWCELNGKQSVNLASISLSRIRLMPVPIPPKALQPAIREQIHDLEVRVRRLKTSTRAVTGMGDDLRRSLLAAAFSGRLEEKVNV